MLSSPEHKLIWNFLTSLSRPPTTKTQTETTGPNESSRIKVKVIYGHSDLAHGVQEQTK